MPEARRFSLAAPARRDLVGIWAWIASDNGGSRADSVIRRLREACAALAANPMIGRERPDVDTGLRSFAVPPHIILYRPTDRGVRVLRFAHGARDLPRVLHESSTEDPR